MPRRAETPVPPLPGPVTMGEFRARLAEMADRVLTGEEIVVLRGTQPIARFVPIEPPLRRRPGVLREMLSASELASLIRSMDEPLSDRDQRVLEGEATDEAGIWVGLPEDRLGSDSESGHG